MFQQNNNNTQNNEEGNQTDNKIPNIFANPSSSSIFQQINNLPIQDNTNQDNKSLTPKLNTGSNLFGQAGNSVFQSGTSQTNLLSNNIFQNTSQNIFGNNPTNNIIQPLPNQSTQLNQSNTQSIQQAPLQIFQSSNQKPNDINNIFFDSKYQTQNPTIGQGQGVSSIFSQNAQPNIFSPQTNSQNVKQGNENVNTNLFGNQTSPLFAQSLDKSRSISPQYPFANQQNNNDQSSDKGQKPPPIPSQSTVSDVKIQKLDVQQNNNKIGLFGLVPQEEKLNSPLFGGEMSPIQKRDDSERILESNQVSVNKADQKSSQEENNNIVNNTDSLEKIELNVDESEEDDLGLGDFSSKPFTTNFQIKKLEEKQSRIESNRFDEEDDQNLKDFGPKDTRVAEQDLSIKKEQRQYQKIDLQKMLVDFEIENDLLKKEVAYQKKTNQELEMRIQQILQDHGKAQKQMKEMFDVQLKRTESMTNKCIENYKNLEKKFAFEMIRVAMIKKSEQQKSNERISKLNKELQLAKIEVNQTKHENYDLMEENKEFKKQQKEVYEYQKLSQKYCNLQGSLSELLIKYQKIEQKRDEEQKEQEKLSKLIKAQKEDYQLIEQLEEVLKSFTLASKQHSQDYSKSKDINIILENEKQKLVHEIEKLQGTVTQQVLHNAKLEEELRTIKGKVHAQVNLNFEQTKVNEELKKDFLHQFEKDKKVNYELREERKRLQIISVSLLLILLFVFTSSALNYIF